jgi:hypothetical protein
MALSDFIRRQREMEAARGNLTPGEWSHRLRGEPTWDWGGSGRYVPEGPIPEDSWQRRQEIMPPNDAFTPDPPMSSLDWQQLALSENLPPAAGNIYDQILQDRARNRGFGALTGVTEDPPSMGQRLKGLLPKRAPPASQPTGVMPPMTPGAIGPQSWSETPQETIGTHSGPYDLIAPPSPPQQDTQSVAAVFGSPQSGATAMAEDPRHKAARIAREAFSRDPSLVKEFLPKLRDAGVDPALGAPEGWSLPEAPETWQTPGFGTETEAERAARRAEQEAAYRRDLFPPGTGIPGPAVPGGPRPGEPLIMPPRANGPANPFDEMGFERTRAAARSPETLRNYEDAYENPENWQARTSALPEPSASPYTGLMPRDPMPRPNIPAARPDYQAPYSGPVPRDPLPRQTAALGSGERLPTPGLPRPRPEEFGPYEGIPAQVADLRNGPRDISRGLIAGGQEARLPLPRPSIESDVAARPPLIDPGRFGAVPPSPVASPLSVRTGLRIPDDASMPPGLAPPVRTGFGNEALGIDPATGLPAMPSQQAAQPPPTPSPIDPAAIAEARQTLQMHPDTGRIRTAPGFQQFNEPARLPPTAEQAARPLIRPDLTQAAANYTPPRLPQARPTPPPIEAMGSDLPEAPPIPGAGSLPASVMESIRTSYNPTASGGPANPETPEEELARKTLIGRLAGDDLIAGPEAGAINAGQPLPPPPEATVAPVTSPPIVEQQTIDTRPPLIAASPDYADYAGSTAQSRRTGLGPFNIFDREHYVGGPGLTASPSTVGTDYTKSADPRRGRYKPAEHERLAGRIGKAAVGIPLTAMGVPLPAAMSIGGMAGRMTNRALDPNRQVIERGPLRFFGGIFGGGSSSGKNKNKDKDKLGTPPSSDPAGVREAAAAASRAGLGSDRYSGGTYGGYGGPLIMEGIGQRFGQR